MALSSHAARLRLLAPLKFDGKFNFVGGQRVAAQGEETSNLYPATGEPQHLFLLLFLLLIFYTAREFGCHLATPLLHPSSPFLPCLAQIRYLKVGDRNRSNDPCVNARYLYVTNTRYSPWFEPRKARRLISVSAPALWQPGERKMSECRYDTTKVFVSLSLNRHHACMNIRMRSKL